jgi:drug/metabolite transporter (DMT)-like permease
MLLAGRRLMRIERTRFEWRWTVPATGILLAAADWLYFHGLAIPDVQISVGSLMRRFSVVITFVLGAVVFRERNLKRKGAALAAILAGVILLCL